MRGRGEGAEARARRLLGAYPWRVRAEQGEEIVGTVLDALPAGSDRLGWRAQLDLVLGGWRVRARRSPPWPTVLAHSLGFRLGPEWIGWVYDDLEDPDYVRVHRQRLLVLHGALFGGLALLLGDVRPLLYGVGPAIGSAVGVPRDHQRRRARHGLAVGGSDPHQVWVVRRRPALVPHLRAAPLLVAVGLGLATGGAIGLDAAARAEVGPPSGVLRVTIHPAAPDDLLARLWGPLGGGAVVGAALLLAGVGALRRSTDRAGRVPARGGWRLDTGATVVAAVLVGVAALVSLPLRWRWLHWAWSAVAAVALPVGIGLTGLGLVAAVAGRRRRAPVGIWDLVPALGPRARACPMARWLVERTPGIEPWSPGPPPPSG